VRKLGLESTAGNESISIAMVCGRNPRLELPANLWLQIAVHLYPERRYGQCVATLHYFASLRAGGPVMPHSRLDVSGSSLRLTIAGRGQNMTRLLQLLHIPSPQLLCFISAGFVHTPNTHSTHEAKYTLNSTLF